MDKQKIAAFGGRVFDDVAGLMTIAMAYLGVKAGLFNAMSGKGALGAEEVIRATGLQRRYVEEWLAGMAATGYLEHDSAANTYTLSDENAFLLASEGTDHYVGGIFYQAVANMAVAENVADSFRTGAGVPFSHYGEENLVGLDLANRGIYEQRFASYWLGKLPETTARLESGGRALDVGCGAGRVTLALARAFPAAHCVGVDLDSDSVAMAREAAGAESLDGRAVFHDHGVEDLPPGETFDLITACDAVHDFATPVETLTAIRERLAPEGVFFLVEPNIHDDPRDNRNPVAVMFYGFSLLHCMSQSLANGGPALGACMGPARTEALMNKAGFSRFEELPIKSPVNRFYAVRV